MLQALERLHSGIGGVCILDASNDFAALLHNLFVRLVLLGVCSYFLGGLAVIFHEQLSQEVVLTAVDVAALFRRVSEARTVQLAEKNITLHVMPTEVNVAAEPALLEQALGNLLDNAIDFTPESGRITLSAEVDQEYVTHKVLDTGSGIPDYALSRIFERFYSLPRANGQKSSGLGVAFVSEVARLFNGEVTLRNVQEGGVLASLRLHRHFT